MADPLRHPLDGIQSLANPIGSPIDKVNVGLFRTKTLFSSAASLFKAAETTTMQRLQVWPDAAMVLRMLCGLAGMSTCIDTAVPALVPIMYSIR